MRKLLVLSFASTVILAAAATAQESSSTSQPPKTETASQEVLKKTTHGRAMLARDAKDPEEGRFLRALSACIRYYTGGNR